MLSFWKLILCYYTILFTVITHEFSLNIRRGDTVWLKAVDYFSDEAPLYMFYRVLIYLKESFNRLFSTWILSLRSFVMQLKSNLFGDLKTYQYLRLHMKIICRRFHINAHFTFWDMHTWNMSKVCLQTFRNNRIG